MCNPMNITVRHYWSKVVEGNYGGEYQQLAIELTLVAIFLPITVYTGIQPGLELFFIGFLLPTTLLTVSCLYSIYRMLVDYLKLRKNNIS